MNYNRDIDGLVDFLNDLINLDSVGVLVDELKAKEKVLSELHALINKVKVPIIITITPDNIKRLLGGDLTKIKYN